MFKRSQIISMIHQIELKNTQKVSSLHDLTRLAKKVNQIVNNLFELKFKEKL